MDTHAQLNEDEARQLRGLAEQLNWVSSQTRGDIAYSLCKVSVAIKNALVNDLILSNKHIRKVRTDTLSIRIVHDLQDIGQGSIICFSDALFANLKESLPQWICNIFVQK